MKTTAKHFAIFQTEALRLINLWGLGLGWDIRIEHQSIRPDWAAETWFDSKARHCVITLNTEWKNNRKISPFGLKEVARHEAIHFLLAPITGPMGRRCVTEYEMDAGEHEVVQHLSRILVKK